MFWAQVGFISGREGSRLLCGCMERGSALPPIFVSLALPLLSWQGYKIFKFWTRRLQMHGTKAGMTDWSYTSSSRYLHELAAADDGRIHACNSDLSADGDGTPDDGAFPNELKWHAAQLS